MWLGGAKSGFEIFNQNNLDDDYIKKIGPNLACAEWLMKNGA